MTKKIDSKTYVMKPGSHPWRICPLEYHWVNEHPRKEDKGIIVLIKGHCRKNPGTKDILTADEIKEISEIFRDQLMPEDFPTKSHLGFGTDGNKYDELIAGWVKYWNETLKLKVKIDPTLIKVLIGSESSFLVKPPTSPLHKAIGLVQLMPETIKLLANSKELKNYHVAINQKDAWEPSVNIASAVRWFVRKRELIKFVLKREPTKFEILEGYKGILGDTSPTAKKTRKVLEQLWAKI
ncbi:MAG: transglycosylase SLT domain-containing protein [Bdellovibrionales bacterium]|nr:transglycosylase SLT domain-containing protein [Bdellovibrionales bacterium]